MNSPTAGKTTPEAVVDDQALVVGRTHERSRPVKNVWKGMVIGALTGAATGLVLDLGERGTERVAALGGAVVEHAPGVADHVRQVVSDAVSSAGEHARSSELSKQAKATTAVAQDKWSGIGSDGLDHANQVVDQGKEMLVESLSRARDAIDRS
jgi:hypothetical protein